MKLIHTSPLGALIIAGVGEVEPRTPFDVDDESAGVLLEQSDLYQLEPASAKPGITELRAQAKELGVDVTGLKKARDIEAAIAAAATEGDPE